MLPFYNFIAFDADGFYAWVPAPGKLQRDPFHNEKGDSILPADIGFEILNTGPNSTAWERVFDNGRVLITDMAGVSHEYGLTARITYLTHEGQVLAEYTTDTGGEIKRLQR